MPPKEIPKKISDIGQDSGEHNGISEAQPVSRNTQSPLEPERGLNLDAPDVLPSMAPVVGIPLRTRHPVRRFGLDLSKVGAAGSVGSPQGAEAEGVTAAVPDQYRRRAVALPIDNGGVHADASGDRPKETFSQALSRIDLRREILEQAAALEKLRDHLSGALEREITVEDLLSAARNAIDQGTKPREDTEAVPALTDGAVLKGFAGLSPRQAQIAVLRYRDNMTQDEIAERLGTSVQNVNSRDVEARRKLAAATGREVTVLPRATDPEVIERIAQVKQLMAHGITVPSEIAQELGESNIHLVYQAKWAIDKERRAAAADAQARAAERREQRAGEVAEVMSDLLTPVGDMYEFEVRGGETVELPLDLHKYVTRASRGSSREGLAPISEGISNAGDASPRQIANLLGVDVKTVHSDVARIRARLRPAGIEVVYHPVLGGYYLESSRTSEIVRYAVQDDIDASLREARADIHTPTSPRQTTAIAQFLDGTNQSVNTALNSGDTKRLESLYRGISRTIVKLIGRNNEGLLEEARTSPDVPSEAEVYRRVSSHMESRDINLETFLRNIGGVFGIREDALRIRDAIDLIEPRVQRGESERTKRPE
jgi:RNA polymerase sigma factor (sigma-70 family)